MIHTCDLLFCRICLLLEYVSSAAGYHVVSAMFLIYEPRHVISNNVVF